MSTPSDEGALVGGDGGGLVPYTPIQRTQLPPGELYSYHKKPTILQDRSCLLMKY